MRINEARFDRVMLWLYYYLGVRDGMSASLHFLNRGNPEASKDAEWRTWLRGFLPPELAALREPNAKLMPAVKLIEQQITEIRNELHAKQATTQKPRKRRTKS